MAVDGRRLRVRKLDVASGDHMYRWRVDTNGNLMRWNWHRGWEMFVDGVWILLTGRHVCYALPGDTYIRVGRQR